MEREQSAETDSLDTGKPIAYRSLVLKGRKITETFLEVKVIITRFYGKLFASEIRFFSFILRNLYNSILGL